VPDTLTIIQNAKGKLGYWLTKVEPLFTNGIPRWTEHSSLGAKADIIALPLTDTADVEFYPYDPRTVPRMAIAPAATVSVVGFPFGMRTGGSLAVWATGFVASEPGIDFENLPVFLIDTRSRPGQSGSPVIAHRNGGAVGMADGSTSVFSGPVTDFLGVYSGRINDQSDIGIVWRHSAVAEVLDAVKGP
jgi:hypothetical protein